VEADGRGVVVEVDDPASGAVEVAGFDRVVDADVVADA